MWGEAKPGGAGGSGGEGSLRERAGWAGGVLWRVLGRGAGWREPLVGTWRGERGLRGKMGVVGRC